MKVQSVALLFLCLAVLPSFLNAEDPNETEETFVSLTRRPTEVSQLPSNISIITSEDIERVGAKTLAEVLSISPAVDVSRSGSLGSFASVRIRGVPTSNQVQILVDDQPLGGVSIQEINVGLIPVQNIDRIEIVRGGSSVLYGANTIGGVIHIFTKRQRETRPTIAVGYERGSFQSNVFTGQVGGKAGILDAFVTANGYASDGFQVNTDVKDKNISGNIGTSFSNGTRLSFDGGYIDHELGTANGTPVPFDQWDGEKEKAANSLTQRVEDKQSQMRLKGELPLGQAGTVQSVVYHSRELYKLRLAPGFDPLAAFDNRIIGNDTRFILDGGLTLGGSYERDAREALGQIPRHITAWGLYLQDQFSSRKWDVSPAVRFDQHSGFGNEVNPRLSVVYHAMPNWNVSANAARSFRAPTLVDLYIVATDPFFPAFDFFGNPNLQPESGWTYDLGNRVKITKTVELGMTGYYTRIDDRITTVDSDGNGFSDTLRNLSVAELCGFEADLKVQTGALFHEANYTFQRAKGGSATSSDFVNLRLTPKHLSNYHVTWVSRFGMSLTNTLQYVAEQYEFDGNLGLKIPSYTLWNARLEQEIKFVKMYFAVNNITDRRYAESITFGTLVPQPDRTYWGGITLRFPSPGNHG